MGATMNPSLRSRDRPHAPWVRAVCALGLAACGDPEPAHRVAAADAATGGAEVPAEGRLRVRTTVAEALDGAWRVQVSTAGRLVAEDTLAPCRTPEEGAADDLCVAFEGLEPGAYVVTVYLDRDGNGALDGCPFPPQLGDTRHPDAFDNLVGQADVLLALGRDADLDVPVDRRVCGPGNGDTGLSGDLRGADETLAAGALFLRLDPSTACGDTPPGAEPPVTVGLDGVRAPGRLSFSIGELLPGCFDLTFFLDADGDGEPTPCDGEPAGGDRVVTRLEGVAIVAGERRALPEAVRLGPSAACPEALTGLTGRIGLGPALLETVAAGGLPAAALEAEPRIHLTALQSGTVFDWPLALDRVPVEIAAPFVVAGLEPGKYDVALYLDGDRDGTFGPCGGLAGGVDAILEQRRSVAVERDALTDLGEVRLTRSPECTALDVEVRLRPEIPLEPGPVGSGRPVRLELLPVDADGERRSVLVFENHATLDDRPATPFGEVRLAAQIRPGTYDARLFVDTDRDGVYGDCRQDPFLDRIAGPSRRVTVEPGKPLDLGDATLEVAGCPVPDVTVTPSFRLAEGTSAPTGLQLRFEISETGGWTEAFPRRMDVPAEALPTRFPTIDLAPGTFTLRAWLEDGHTPIFDPCEAATPDPFLGVATFTLDARTLTVVPEVVLDRACPVGNR